MIFKLILVTLNLFQIIDCKLYRAQVDDIILPHIDKTVPSYMDYFLLDHFILEQIDDDNVQIGGYMESIKSMVRSVPLQLHIHTQYYDKAKWNEAAYQLTLPSACPEFVNPNRLWYNITKLWDSSVCPSQIGDHWNVEPNQMNVLVELPPTMPIVPWKVYVLVSQGLPGFEIFKYGFGLRVEFLPIK